MTFYKKACLSVLWLFLTAQPLYSQAISIPDTLQGWDTIWMAGLNGSQAAYNNWSQGGASSVSGTGSSVFTLLNRKGERGYGFRVNLKYGQSYNNGQGIRKTDDVLSIRNRVTKSFKDEKKLAVYVSTWFQTQFDEGYNYNAGVGESDSLISDFLSPAYITESMGLAYTPDDFFTMEVGIGLKQTIIKNGDLSVNYGLNPGEHFVSEGGVSTGLNYKKEIFTNIYYTASFETFTNLLNGLKKTDIYWYNELHGEINKVVSATFQFELRYDNDFSSQFQMKEVLSAGVSLKIF